MGPHPDNVDVHRYIGSCLITQQQRSKRKPCPRGGGTHHQKESGGRCNSGGRTGYIQNKTTSMTPGYNSISNYAWTGIPLISVARRGKNNLSGKNRMQPRNMAKQQLQDYTHAESPVEGGGSLDEILPISRLAIHAQGAPLILSPKDCDKASKDPDGFTTPFKGHDFYLGGEGNGRLYMLMSGCPDDVVSHSPRAERSLSGGSSVTEDDSECSRAISASPQSDMSTASEDSGTSENGLPRIIKPRKRRKKDRRSSECESPGESSGAIVTLKPYQPLCYPYSSSGDTFRILSKPSRGAPSSCDMGTDLRRGVYPYPPSPRCCCPECVPPPSTLLTPPDSPVSGDGILAMAARAKDGKFRLSEDDVKMSLEESVFKVQNTLVLTSSHPPPRPWIQVCNQSPQSSCSFTVMCYNILCDKYATRQMYGYCPNWALDWTYRKKHILQEIFHYKADIISLQEVETEQYYKFFLPELKSEGYDGIFSPKSRAKTMSENERKHVDGCAIFFKSDKFFLLKEHLVEFNQLAMANAEGSDDMLNRVMTKDNIGLAALLQTKVGAYQIGPDLNQTSQTLLVCTAHIHWDPEYSDVKLIQTMMLMHELKSFVDDILQKCNLPPPQKADPNLIPLLLCGDFNSLPHSGVIEYLSSGRVSTSHIDFKEIVYKDCLSKLGSTAQTNEFTHPFQITRAYSDGIMPFTNYSYDFKGVIDYVFYSKLHMNVLGVLGPIDSNWLEENRIHGCPHPHVPSDHFPIVVELQLYPTLPLHSTATPNGVSLHR